MDELLDRIRKAANQAGERAFLELLRWHRAVAGLPDIDSNVHGAYRHAIAELGDGCADELLRDLRRAGRDRRRHRHGANGKPRHRAGHALALRPRRQERSSHAVAPHRPTRLCDARRDFLEPSTARGEPAMDPIALGVAGVASVAIATITAGGFYSWGWNVVLSEAERQPIRDAFRDAGAGSIADHI